MNTDLTEPQSFRLSTMTAHEFLCQITDTIDSNPDLKAFTIRYVDRFKTERLMTLELQDHRVKVDPTEH